ncbi:C-terminal binding protein [Haloarcula nitratireducens]|uniref:C-terminal binding protein n=1 Tax=Haloarcula nitratireducens TaxID=2487749 RepID=A0AAW4PC50_9EURY|nr:C-terminal binding protein [Halomicroarcula nitratireducens]MBX0295040.1 C-terminal binding protein [Halomicroarcula nitratireducens]
MSYTVVLCDNKTVDPTTQSEILEAAGATIEILDEKTESAVADAVRGADGIIVDAGTPITEAALAGTETLRVVGRAGIGVDNIDVDAAAANDITVVNVPDYCLDEVSTHALSLLLACVRAVPHYDREVKDGTWDWATGQPLHRMAGRTLGLAGFGRIARRLASKLRAYRLDVVAQDPNVDAATMEDYGVEKVSFEGLLDRSDFLSVHTPLFEETRHLFSTEEFERMRDDAIVVNTSRGPVLDEDALVAALDDGEIAKAGLDVLDSEPPSPDNPLFDREDVVLTPHVGWYSEESRADLSRGVASDVAAVLQGEAPSNPVDPETPWL